MRVILLQDVKGVGKKNQIVVVSDGYGSNFLIPRKLAVRYSEKGVEVRDKQIQHEKDEFARKQQEAREVKVKDKLLALTTHEFEILNILVKNPDKVFSREILYSEVWKNGYYGEDNSVNVHISNIRKKIKEIIEEEYIKTVWGIGFKMNNN